MRRIFAALAILVVVLSVALGLRIRQLGAYAHAPSGGSGTVEGVEVHVTSRIGARIKTVAVREGDAVKAGQVLVELDCAEPEALLAEARARAGVAEASVSASRAAAAAAGGNTSAARFAAEASVAQTKALDADKGSLTREASRLASLYSSGSISNSQMDQIDARAEGVKYQVDAMLASQKAAQAKADSAWRTQLSADAQTETARRNVQVADASIRRAELAVAECKLTAPRNAMVLTRNFEPGEVALPGSHLLTLVDLDEVRTTFYLPNAELAAAAPGRRVRVHADPYPTEAFTGTIFHVAEKAEFTPRNIQTREDRDRLVYGVQVALPNPGHRLLPGMPVEVVIEGTSR
jgi:HlyD family secretion protein